MALLSTNIFYMDGRMDGWMDGWTDGRTDGWMDGQIDIGIYPGIPVTQEYRVQARGLVYC